MADDSDILKWIIAKSNNPSAVAQAQAAQAANAPPSPAQEKSNKALAKDISDQIIKGLSPILSKVIQSNSEKLEKYMIQEKQEIDVLNSSVGNLTGEVVNTNALLTNIYELLRSMKSTGGSGSGSGAGWSLPLGLLGLLGGNSSSKAEEDRRKAEEEARKKAEDERKNQNNRDRRKAEKDFDDDEKRKQDAKDRVKNAADEKTEQDERSNRIKNSGKRFSEINEGMRGRGIDATKIPEDEVKRLKRIADYEPPPKNAAGEYVSREGGKRLNSSAVQAVEARIAEAGMAQARLAEREIQKIIPPDSIIDDLDKGPKNIKKISLSSKWRNALKGSSYDKLGKSGKLYKLTYVGSESALEFFGKTVTLAIIALELYNTYNSLKEITSDKSTTDDQKKDKINELLVNGLFLKFGSEFAVMILISMGIEMVLAPVAATSIAGLLITTLISLFGSVAAAAYFGEATVEQREILYQWLLKGTKPLLEQIKDVNRTPEMKAGNKAGLVISSLLTDDTPGSYTKYTGAIRDDDFRTRGIGTTDASGATNIYGGIRGNGPYNIGAAAPKTFGDLLSSKNTSSTIPVYPKQGPMGDVRQYKKAKNKVSSKEIYEYLKSKGVDQTHAIGMIANIEAESGFDSGIVGDNGTSGGLFQHHNERFAKMVSVAGPDWQKNWKGQIDYALSEQDTKNYLAKQFQTPEEASQWFTKHWERPANAAFQAQLREGNVAKFKNLENSADIIPPELNSGSALNSVSKATDPVTAPAVNAKTTTGSTSSPSGTPAPSASGPHFRHSSNKKNAGSPAADKHVINELFYQHYA
jgi:hypothetical protein